MANPAVMCHKTSLQSGNRRDIKLNTSKAVRDKPTANTPEGDTLRKPLLCGQEGDRGAPSHHPMQQSQESAKPGRSKTVNVCR